MGCRLVTSAIPTAIAVTVTTASAATAAAATKAAAATEAAAITTAAGTTITTTTAARATITAAAVERAFARGAGFIDTDVALLELSVVEAVDRILGGLRRFHLHEAEALGATSGTVSDHSGGNYWTSLCKKRTQIFVSRGIAQIANLQFLSHKILSIA